MPTSSYAIHVYCLEAIVGAHIVRPPINKQMAVSNRFLSYGRTMCAPTH